MKKLLFAFSGLLAIFTFVKVDNSTELSAQMGADRDRYDWCESVGATCVQLETVIISPTIQ